MEGKFTTIGTDMSLHPRIIKVQLNQNLCKSKKGLRELIYLS